MILNCYTPKGESLEEFRLMKPKQIGQIVVLK